LRFHGGASQDHDLGQIRADRLSLKQSRATLLATCRGSNWAYALAPHPHMRISHHDDETLLALGPVAFRYWITALQLKPVLSERTVQVVWSPIGR
jgi:hypothetical protein